MVGAGQLARMTQQAAIALGQSVRLLADSPDDGAALVAPDVVIGDHRSLADLRRFAAGCDAVTFDHEHVPNEHIAALEQDGRAGAPRLGGAAVRAGQAGDARAARRAGRPVPAVDPDRFGAGVGGVRRDGRLAGRAEGRDRWLRRPRRVGRRRRARGGGRAGLRHPAHRRGTGADRARTRRARRPFAVRPGCRVAGRGDGAARRDLRRGPRAGTRPRRRPRRRGGGPGAAHRRRARGHRRAGRGAVPDRGRAARQRAGDAPAQQRPLDDRGRADLPVRTAPAGRPGLPARLDRAGGAGRGHGQPARRPTGRRAGRPGRARPPLHGALARREAAPVRQGHAARAQGRPCDRGRRRPRRAARPRPRRRRLPDERATPDDRRRRDHGQRLGPLGDGRGGRGARRVRRRARGPGGLRAPHTAGDGRLRAAGGRPRA